MSNCIFFKHNLGRAFSALGRKEEALLVWEKGHEYALHQSADLKQLLELEELLTAAKEERSILQENYATESETSMLASESGPPISESSSETFENHHSLIDHAKLRSESRDASEVQSKSSDNFESCNGTKDKARGKEHFGSQMNGNHYIHDKSSYESESSNDSSDTCNELSMVCSSSSLAQNSSKMSNKFQTIRSDESKKNKKFSVTRISKAKSFSVDFRLSRGIAEVCCYVFAWEQMPYFSTFIIYLS